jgi:hypothetical protein
VADAEQAQNLLPARWERVDGIHQRDLFDARLPRSLRQEHRVEPLADRRRDLALRASFDLAHVAQAAGLRCGYRTVPPVQGQRSRHASSVAAVPIWSTAKVR